MPRGWGRNYDYHGKPRKACTAYNFFIQENYRFLRRILRDRDPHRILAEASSRWRQCDVVKKKQFQEMARLDKIRAAREKAEYLKMVADGTVLPEIPKQRVSLQDGYPKPTRNAFIFYYNATQTEVSKEFPRKDSREVMQECAKRWKKLSVWNKMKYTRMREDDKRRFRVARTRFRDAKKAQKKKERVVEGRDRLNRLFHQNVPDPRDPLLDLGEAENPVVA